MWSNKAFAAAVFAVAKRNQVLRTRKIIIIIIIKRILAKTIVLPIGLGSPNKRSIRFSFWVTEECLAEKNAYFMNGVCSVVVYTDF